MTVQVQLHVRLKPITTAQDAALSLHVSWHRISHGRYTAGIGVENTTKNIFLFLALSSRNWNLSQVLIIFNRILPAAQLRFLNVHFYLFSIILVWTKSWSWNFYSLSLHWSRFSYCKSLTTWRYLSVQLLRYGLTLRHRRHQFLITTRLYFRNKILFFLDTIKLI
jgi:hypothetical protein